MASNLLKPPTPGEILLKEFLEPLKMSQYRLAKELHVLPMKISEIVNGKRSISVNTALRLGKFFGTSAQFWLNLQNLHDLRRESVSSKKELEQIEVFQG